MKKLLLVSLLAIGCTMPENTNTKIGYENDNDTSYDITVGDISSLEVVKAFFDAYNNKDLQAVYDMEHDDVLFYTPSGKTITSRQEHLELGKEFMDNNSIAKWDIVWSMSGQVNYPENPSENWVTSGVLVTIGNEDETTTISRVVDLQIVDGKVKKGYVYQRQLAASEGNTPQ